MSLRLDGGDLIRQRPQTLTGLSSSFFETHSLNVPGLYSPDSAVPADQRVFGARDLFSLWFSLGIGLMVLQTGVTGAGPGPVRCVAGNLSRHAGGCRLTGVGRVRCSTCCNRSAGARLEIIVMRDAASLLSARAFSNLHPHRLLRVAGAVPAFLAADRFGVCAVV